jgi:hypothetical protein
MCRLTCTDRWLLLVGVVFVSLVALSIVKSRLVAPVWSYVSSSPPNDAGARAPASTASFAPTTPTATPIPPSTRSAPGHVPPPPTEQHSSPTPASPSHDRSRRDHAASANSKEPPRRQAESQPHGQPTQSPSRQHSTAGSHRTARQQRGVHDEL